MHLSLLFELTKRDFKERYSGSMLGVAWAFVWPMANILIYILVFGRLMGERIPGGSATHAYSIYLISGLIPWTTFANTLQRSACVFIDKKPIISKINISLPMFPVYVVISETWTFLIMFGLSLAYYLLSGGELHRSFVVLPFLFAVQQIFAYALGFLAATVSVFLRDVREIVGIGLQIWFWVTPVVYLENILPDWMQRLMEYNPAYWFVSAHHAILLDGAAPRTWHLLSLTLLGHGILLFAYILFRRHERIVRDLI